MSLESRITMPTGNTDWADDVEGTVVEGEKKTDDQKSESKPESQPESSLAAAQTDGAPQQQAGSQLQEPEYDVEVQLADMQSDPNNPLFSAKEFSDLGLSKEILDGIFSMNFRKPSKIQERALPLLLMNPPTNLIGQSQSGTGKTAAFVLNMLARTDVSLQATQALVLAPSRELARQILGVVQLMGQFIPGLKVALGVPDLTQRGKKIEGHIIVGTPGTCMDLIRRRQIEAQTIKVLVLDEADNMLDQQGLGDQCIRVKK